MAFKNIIAHRLTRPTPTGAVNLIFATKPLDENNGLTQDLCRELKHTYIRKAGKVYGWLSDNSAEFPIKNWIREYLDDKIPFDTLSKNLMKQLKNVFDQCEALCDYYLLMFHEQLESGSSLYICLVEHSNAHFFDGDLALDSSLYLDTENVHLGLRVKLDEMLAGEGHKYLSVQKWRGEKDLSDAFIQFSGLAEQVDIAEETQEFLELVSAYTTELPKDQAKSTEKDIVDYCLSQDKLGESISLEALSQQVSNPDAPSFSQFAKTRSAKVKDELIPDKSKLREFVRISGRNEQMSMSFSSSTIGQSVFYDAENDSIVIKSVPANLKSKIVEYLKNNKAL